MNEWLLALDFDGTMFDTFALSPNGVSVPKSTCLGVQAVFGDRGVDLYNSQGGLNNRAPTEIAHDLTTEDPSLIECARQYWQQHAGELTHLVPEGKGRSLERWNEDVIAELLVRAKLAYSIAEIGTEYENGNIWPQPCEGFLEFWYELKERRLESDCGITIAIISSGHDKFIIKTLETWELSLPDILVTEDDIRGLYLPDRVDLRVKPGPTPMMLAYEKWRDQRDQSGSVQLEGHVYPPMLDGDRIVYIGDDPIKDGKLASQNAIEFGYFNIDGPSFTQEPGMFEFNNWSNVSSLIERR